MSNAYGSHYGENWTDNDKKMFDALVKEEMEKVERGFQSQLSFDKPSSKSVPQDSYDYPPNNTRMQRSNSNSIYPPRDLSGRNGVQDHENNGNQLNQMGNLNLNLNSKAQDKNPGAISTSKSDRYYAAMDAKGTTEQSFTSKLGEYDNMNRDQKRSKQREYAQQLSQQMNAIQNSTDDRSNIGRISSRGGRSNSSSNNNMIGNSNEQFAIGSDPATQRQQEKLKKQEYARMLNQQVDYQKATNHDDDDFIGRSRGYSDSKAMNVGMPSSRDPYSISPRNGNTSARAPYANGSSSGFQIGQDLADEKRRKKEKQEEYLKMLNADVNSPSKYNNNNGSNMYSNNATGRSASASRQPRSAEEDLPGGGFLNIGERQQQQRYPSRSKVSVEDQESNDKRRLAQQDYSRMLDQDKASYGGMASSSSAAAASLASAAALSRQRSERNPYMDEDVPSQNTGLMIGRDSNSGGSDRRMKQQEYRQALAQDVATKSVDPNSLEKKKNIRPSSYRNMEDNSASNDSYRSCSNPYDYGNSGSRSSSRGRDRQASGSSMADIMGRGGGPVTAVPPAQRSMNPITSNYGDLQPYSNKYSSPSNSLSRNNTGDYRARGTSTGGGASSILLG